MMNTLLKALFVGLAGWTGSTAAVVTAPAAAQDYPSRLITLTVAYAPGGATDLQARLVTMVAEQYLGQPIVISNRPGEGGRVGWNWLVEEAPKDGYTLSAYNLPHLIAQSIALDTKYDAQNIEPIANWGADPAVLVVPPDSPFDSVQDLVLHAKAHAGEVTVSGAGLYVGHHIAALQLEKAGGIDLQYVPTPGGGVEALELVLGRESLAGFNNLSDAYRARERLKILAVADLERSPFLPEVPTFEEQGFGVDDTSVNFRGIAAPSGVPQEALDLLAEKVPAMFQDPKVVDAMAGTGAPMRVLDREHAEALFAEQQERLQALLADLEAVN